MAGMICNRTVLIFNEADNVWVERNFEDLRCGNIFKIMDGKNRYVNEKTGDNVWIASGDPYIDDRGLWSIKTLY